MTRTQTSIDLRSYTAQRDSLENVKKAYLRDPKQMSAERRNLKAISSINNQLNNQNKASVEKKHIKITIQPTSPFKN